jgi:hypothetical protein
LRNRETSSIFVVPRQQRHWLSLLDANNAMRHRLSSKTTPLVIVIGRLQRHEASAFFKNNDAGW